MRVYIAVKLKQAQDEPSVSIQNKCVCTNLSSIDKTEKAFLL